MELNYDSINDVLYIGIDDRGNSYGNETSSGFIVLRDMDTDAVTGITILDFCKRYKGKENILRRMGVQQTHCHFKGGSTMAYIFLDEDHRNFFEEKVRETGSHNDAYRKAFFYTLGLTETTRNHIADLYDFDEGCIKLSGLRKPWQTGTSLRLSRLALNLYNGYTGSGKSAPGFTPDELFADELMEYMLEAVKIRHSGYTHISE